MSETTPCPGCRAELMLPGLSMGQTVQCPRCGHVFAPFRQNAPPMVVAPRPVVFEDLDDDAFDATPALALFRPLRGEWKASVAIFFLVLSVCSYGVQLYVNWEQAHLIQQEARNAGRLENWRTISELATGVHYTIFWPTMIMVVIWLDQAARNLPILMASGMRFSPGDVLVSFIIPIVNLWLPYQAVQEIWRASDPNSTRDSAAWQLNSGGRPVLIWWISFLAAVVLYIVTLWLYGRVLEGRVGRNGPELIFLQFQCAANFFTILAGIALISVIYGIRARQRERHARIYDEAA